MKNIYIKGNTIGDVTIKGSSISDINITDNSSQVQKNKRISAVIRNSYYASVNELSIDCGGLNFLTIIGTHINGGFIAFPGYGVSAELSIDDSNYNTLQIFNALKFSDNSWLPKSNDTLKNIARELSITITPVIKQLHKGDILDLTIGKTMSR